MYQDPKRIRKYRATMNLDDYEQALIVALVNYTGIDQAELLRRLALEQARELLLAEPMLGLPSA
ncbi:TPA: hypothetical protein N0H38_004466 [Pseudomonas aeruginosa]|uniref:hypothetical protein n=1 Tax=Pseudomonas nitroreducens TaxID=46680 RepID=UPI00244A6CCE|nr:hypothetical protein [Pseudomonas nitroreducens]HCK4503003.1 hypothetical protein [Pseudomonas aeruginosa]MDG9854139.1 hypothetical protein [Pseudomonas nitroreducens]HCK4574096.1 hypothetical protein [Pseudomonas aeruginosa]HCK4790539.1 hypothetical protein [Pseudomonas aeruginosa]HCK4799649.1 hypothetical protein [Pseudomonas aeruginosa]